MITVKIVDVDGRGRASKIKGTSHYSWPSCAGDPTQTTKSAGRRT